MTEIMHAHPIVNISCSIQEFGPGEAFREHLTDVLFFSVLMSG
jgi:hypothetical protein